MKKYWYAPQLRPPQFGGMPHSPQALPEQGRLFPRQQFQAWAYEDELSDEIIERFSLKLVSVETIKEAK